MHPQGVSSLKHLGRARELICNTAALRLICGCCCADIELLPSDCSDGDVRLVSGNNPLEGRLEVCFNHVWGTVCDNGFNADDAEVVCNQLSLVPFQGELHAVNVCYSM